MAKKTFRVKLSSVVREIDKATKKLKAIRRRVALSERKRLDLDIKELNTAKKMVRQTCKHMTTSFIGG